MIIKSKMVKQLYDDGLVKPIPITDNRCFAHIDGYIFDGQTGKCWVGKFKNGFSVGLPLFKGRIQVTIARAMLLAWLPIPDNRNFKATRINNKFANQLTNLEWVKSND